MTPLQLIVGLGNPGSKHEATRHNAGFWFVDRVAARFHGEFRPASRFSGDLCELRIGARTVRLLKPSTYMNNSGQAVAAIVNFYRYSPSSVLVVHDEIDLPPGVARVKTGGGTGGHRGLEDIVPHLHTKSFSRLRLGVGHPGSASQVVGYVLKRAPSAEQALIDSAMERALGQIDDIIAGELQLAMNVLHRKEEEANSDRETTPAKGSDPRDPGRATPRVE